MFEYELTCGADTKKVNINPKYITAISSLNCDENCCCIYTFNGIWYVNESYDKVNKHYSNWLARCG